MESFYRQKGAEKGSFQQSGLFQERSPFFVGGAVRGCGAGGVYHEDYFTSADQVIPGWLVKGHFPGRG